MEPGNETANIPLWRVKELDNFFIFQLFQSVFLLDSISV